MAAGVAVTIAAGGHVFFSFFFFLRFCQTKNRPRKRCDRGRFFHTQLRELYEADFNKPGINGSG